MRFAYISSDFGIPVHGSKGASIHVRELSHALTTLGHEVAIFTCRPGGSPPPGFQVPVHDLPLPETEKLLYDLLRDDPNASEAIAKEVRSTLYATALRHRALPMLRDWPPDAIYERYALFGTAGLALARELDVPLILEVNAPLSEEHATHRGLAFAQTARAVERMVLCAADQVIAVSQPLQEWMVAIGVKPERITVLPNGVDVDRFAGGPAHAADVCARLGLVDRPVIGFVGTLKAWHGTATLLRAVAMLCRQRGEAETPHLLIVGEGPQRAQLEAIAEHEGIAHLTVFTGAVPHDQMPAHVAAMDITVAPYDQSPNFYFSPLKLFEYMAAGRPVVAAGIGQIVDCVQDGTTGLLYPPGDAAALAATLSSLLDDPARAAALGQAGQAYVQIHHTWDRNARAVADLARVGKSRVARAL